MNLFFNSTYLSLKNFPNVQLPSFTLVTGLNGTGKSHLLQAIKAGKIGSDITTDVSQEIRLEDWSTLIPQDSGTYDGRTWTQQRTSLRDHVMNFQRQRGGEILDIARKAGLPSVYLKDSVYVSNLSLEELTDILSDDTQAKVAKEKIDQKTIEISNQIKGQLSNNNEMRESIAQIARHIDRPLLALDDREFFTDGDDRWGKREMFQQNLAQVFVAYRDASLKNELKQRAQERGRTTDALTNSEFIAKYMIAPWSFVNETLRTAHLDFEIDHPDLDDYLPYQPKLTKRSTGARVFFSDLSSGEKILMSLALTLYHTDDKRQLTTYPKILLLDEIDAPLHPSMSRFYLDVITKTIIAKNNISVIATTHSPSTVALAPDESIYVLERGKDGLQKTTKSHALNILTEGVPTLAISFEGRRQVFVESDKDARLYDMLNQNIKETVRSERSLEFIATGIKHPKNGSDLNTGCDVVRHLVQTLCEAGNKSIFGLIDWDGKNTASSRIAVLASGRRNGLENVVLDPLLIAAFLAARDQRSAQNMGVSAHTSYLSFLNLSPEELQPVVDKVQETILQKPAISKIKCTYLGGFELDIEREYLEIDDHKLEQLVTSAFSSLNGYSRSGSLMIEIARTVLKDKPGFTPIEINEAFLQLLNANSH